MEVGEKMIYLMCAAYNRLCISFHANLVLSTTILCDPGVGGWLIIDIFIPGMGANVPTEYEFPSYLAV